MENLTYVCPGCGLEINRTDELDNAPFCTKAAVAEQARLSDDDDPCAW